MISEAELNKIESLIRECSDVMLSAHNIENVNDNIHQKTGDANFVTVYDVKVQNMLIDGLIKIFPDAHFLAEEKENAVDEFSDGIWFVIDPIDGTTNFIHDLRTSAISLGMAYNGEPVFGVIADPYRNEIFTAVKGKGAYLNGKKISVSSRSMDKALISFGSSPYYKNELAEMSFDVAHKLFMKCADIRRSGSAAIDIANVACGRTDGFFEMKLSPWDFFAGYVIVTEAGGKMTTTDGKEINKCKESGMFCGNSVINDEVIELINEVVTEHEKRLS